MAAVLDDEDVARRLLAESGRPVRREMTMYGWSPVVELLTAQLEATLRLTAITIAANSKDGKPPKVNPLPRPETAVQRIRLREGPGSLTAVIEAFRPRE